MARVARLALVAYSPHLFFYFLGFHLRKTAISTQATVRCKWYTYHRRITRNIFFVVVAQELVTLKTEAVLSQLLRP